MEINEQIESVLSKYENLELLDYITQVIEQKNGSWENGIEDGPQNLTTMLLYEYATSIEKISKGKLTAEFVIKKLANQMGKLRFGDFRKGEDDEIKYGGNSVTSKEYQQMTRIKSNFGAHTVAYGKSNEILEGVVLFDDKQCAEDGAPLSGIDLSDLDDIRHTAFHEWTHVMEKSLLEGELSDGAAAIYKDENSIYINTMVDDNVPMEEYLKYIDDMQKNPRASRIASGVSTIEINLKDSPDKRIMHNQISEGFTEYVSRLVMNEVGAKVKHPDRYAKQVEVATIVFGARGIDNAITDYLTRPDKLVGELEKNRIGKTDALHYFRREQGRQENLDNLAKQYFSKEEIDGLKQKVEGFWNQGAQDKDETEKFISDVIEQIRGKEGVLDGNNEAYIRRLFNEVISIPQTHKEYLNQIASYYKEKEDKGKQPLVSEKDMKAAYDETLLEGRNKMLSDLGKDIVANRNNSKEESGIIHE